LLQAKDYGMWLLTFIRTFVATETRDLTRGHDIHAPFLVFFGVVNIGAPIQEFVPPCQGRNIFNPAPM
jgi:hypothetical protein